MKDVMSPDKITVHPSVPLGMRVVIALYKLSSCREYSLEDISLVIEFLYMLL